MRLADYKPFFSRLLLIFAGLCFLGLLEAGLWAVGFGENFDFVIEEPGKQSPAKKSLNSQYIALHYFRHLPVKLGALFKENPWFEDTAFKKEKSPDSIRIFCIGASTTRGFPFTNRRISYSGFLQEILSDLLPNKNIEVINAGYDALSSYGVLDVFGKIIDQQADLIFIYTGHNEFIGHFGVNSKINYGNNHLINRLLTGLFGSRLFLLAERGMLKVKSIGRQEAAKDGRVNMFKTMLSQKKMNWEDADHLATARNFEKNLIEILKLARQKGMPVLLSTLASNTRDFSPLQSEFSSSTTPEERANSSRAFQEGNKFYAQDEYDKAAERFNIAVSTAPNYARYYYWLGKAYDKSGKLKRARRAYNYAREMDKIHLRACLLFNQIITSVGRKNDVPVLVMEKEFEKAAESGFVGNEFFLEHVHPNINGHLLMAHAIAKKIQESRLLETSDAWEWERIKSAAEYVRDVGFNKEQFINSRYTVGRMLLDFPFYKCEQGVENLKAANKLEYEKEWVGQCRQTVASRQ